MNTEWTVFSAKCPSRQSLARIANKWTAMTIILLAEKPARFGELHRKIDGISKKVLTDTLRSLERDGMIRRTAHTDGFTRYNLTELGATLQAPLYALQQWAETHIEEVLEAQEEYDIAAEERVLGSPNTA